MKGNNMSIRVVDEQTKVVTPCIDMIDAALAVSQIAKGRENDAAQAK